VTVLGCFSKREGRYPKPPCPLENITATTNCSTFQPFVIECDASGNVIRLQLSQIANDGGFLSQSISALTALEHLDLGYSNLVSTLPATLFQLTRLTHLVRSKLSTVELLTFFFFFFFFFIP
jgi:hypothetical protein